MDDASYSGEQIIKTIKNVTLKVDQQEKLSLLETGQKTQKINLKFVVACVYMTDFSFKAIKDYASKNKVTVIILRQQLIRTMAEILSLEETQRLDQLWYPSETLIQSRPKPKGLSSVILGSKNSQNDSIDKTGALGHLAQSTKGCKSRTLTYFEHKLPDEFSFPKSIAIGKAFDGGKEIPKARIFLIISQLEPPYKLSDIILKITSFLNLLNFSVKQNSIL